MDKALCAGRSIIVPVKTLDLAVLKDIFRHPAHDREYDCKDFHEKLTTMLPDFRDEHIPYRAWRPEFYGEGAGPNFRNDCRNDEQPATAEE